MSSVAAPRMLTRIDCLTHLEGAETGLLMYSAHCLPRGQPILLHLFGSSLHIAFSRDIDRNAIREGNVVAVEIDDASLSSPATWSVTATGVVCETTGETDLPSDWETAGLCVLSLSLDQLVGYQLNISEPDAP